MHVPPIVKRYDYKPMQNIDGTEMGRVYVTPDGNLPSVTTILSATADKEWLEAWKRWIGKANAEEIVLESTVIGSFMHENLERRLDGLPDHDGGMPVRVLARKMADCIQENAWPNIDEIWGQEVPLYFPNLWAGRTDLLGVHNGIPSIMDYKNSRKPKTWEMVADYILQTAAYALAHNEMFGTDIKRGVLFVCVRQDPNNLQYQEFVIEGEMFEKAKIEWAERVEKYYNNLNSNKMEK